MTFSTRLQRVSRSGTCRLSWCFVSDTANFAWPPSIKPPLAEHHHKSRFILSPVDAAFLRFQGSEVSPVPVNNQNRPLGLGYPPSRTRHISVAGNVQVHTLMHSLSSTPTNTLTSPNSAHLAPGTYRSFCKHLFILQAVDEQCHHHMISCL